ncbi:MAG: 30S ribosomal protein S17 [candidate division Zixibacteria bacterium]
MSRGFRKTRSGVVVTDAMDKTIVVSVERLLKHSVFGKIMRKRKKLYVHDEENQAGKGDTVLVAETRPLSKTKTWRLVKVLEKAK